MAAQDVSDPQVGGGADAIHLASIYLEAARLHGVVGIARTEIGSAVEGRIDPLLIQGLRRIVAVAHLCKGLADDLEARAW